MKKGIHPENYRPVVFKDMSNGDMFLTKSTAKTNDTVEFEGETYPVVKVEISSTSHPFYTGKSKLVDTAGRVDKFMSRYGKAAKKKTTKFTKDASLVVAYAEAASFLLVKKSENMLVFTSFLYLCTQQNYTFFYNKNENRL